MSWIKGRHLWVRHGGQTADILVIRKSLGKAVVRNRLKRRLRSLCRERPGRPTHLVIFPQPSAVNATFRHLEVDLDAVLARMDRRP